SPPLVVNQLLQCIRRANRICRILPRDERRVVQPSRCGPDWRKASQPETGSAATLRTKAFEEGRQKRTLGGHPMSTDKNRMTCPADQPPPGNRRDFLGALGVTVGGTGLAGAGLIAGPRLVRAANEPPKGKIPDTPFKTGHMTFLTSAAAVLGEPSLRGH